MKNALSIALFFMVLFSCSQQQEKGFNLPMNTQNNSITVDNFTDKVWENVKHYDKEPMYLLRFTKNNCIAEVLVNDYIIDKNYDLSNWATPKEINWVILKSGVQTITVRMYPVGDLLKESYGEGETISTLEKNTSMDMQVIRVDDWKKYSLDEEKVILEHHSPTDKKGDFIGAGLPYYEYTFSFNAQVPYENEGWSKGVDLTKLDQKILEQKVLEYYKNMQQVYINEDMNFVLQSNFSTVVRTVTAEYKSKDRVDTTKEEILNGVKRENKDFFPLEHYKMEFYGNGKLVLLRFPVVGAFDERLKGLSTFTFKYKKPEGNTKIRYNDLYLYLPEEVYKKTGEIQLQMMK